MKRNDNIQKELISISETVFNLSALNTYRVPDGYFDSLTDSIISAIRQKDHIQIGSAVEIEQLSPVIARLKNKPTYTVREDYFTDQVQEVSKISDRQRLKIIRTNRPLLITRFAVAASLITMIGITVLFFNLIDRKQTKVLANEDLFTEEQINNQLEKIETEQIIAYLEEYNLPGDRNKMEACIEPADLPDDIEYFHEKMLDELFSETRKEKITN